MGIVTVFIAIFVLGDVLWWWRAHVRVRPFRWARWWQFAVALFALLQFGGIVAIIAARSTGTPTDEWLGRPWISLVYLWHFLGMLPWLLFWLVIGCCRLIAKALRSSGQTPGNAAEPQPEQGLTRRDFLFASGALAPAVLTLSGTAAGLRQIEDFRVRRLDVRLPQLPAALEGLTIAHVSDVHVGRFTHGKVLEQIVATTNNLNADLVLLTGDLINFSLGDLPTAIDLVKGFRAGSGVFLCEGNHDLIENGAEFERGIRAAGLALLINESAEVEARGAKVQLLGLRWGSGQRGTRRREHGDSGIRTSMRDLLATRKADAFPILLAHHPHAFDYAGDVPLTLAGHTHGGQIMFSPEVGFGPWMFRYWSGLYERENRSVVVSNGVGNWFPLRTYAPAEIVHLTLRRPIA